MEGSGGPSWLLSPQSWGGVGCILAQSWASEGHLDSKLGHLGFKLRVLGDILGSCWGYVGAMLEHLGTVL